MESEEDSNFFEVEEDSTDSQDALSVVFNKDIRPLIDLIDKLRRYGIQQDVQLPNVVVVGDQSSGKSSIIEALSGVQLPRGKGIVTRCPLELQLKRVYNKPWKAKLTYKNRNGVTESVDITRPGEVELNVRRAQETICGPGKGVSNQLITLRLESPEESAPDLTLIDLPGIARIAVDDQPHNICDTIRDMIMEHVKSERTVILCVIAANLDVAVNESVKIARTVDPNGERTIGVITKPDAAEQSSKEDVLSVLHNDRIKLLKGFTMVKCRSQPELERQVSLKDSLQNEKDFFETDRIYRQANKSQLGIMNLAKKISEELVNVIKKSLPELKAQIENALQRAHDDLDKLAEAIPTEDIDKKSYLSRIIWNLNSILKNSLREGKSSDKTENFYFDWREYFNSFLAAMELKTKRALESKFSKSNLEAVILRARGRELAGFLDFDLFKTLAPKHVNSYEEDSMELLKKMRTNVESCLSYITNSRCGHLPEVEKDLKQIINEETQKLFDEAWKKIKFILKQESIVFTMDPIFNKEMKDFKIRKEEKIEENKKKNKNLPAIYQQIELEEGDSNSEELNDMFSVYLNIVNHRLSDVIPMTIMQCLLMDLAKSLEYRLINLSSSSDIIDKVRENPTLSEKRKVFKDKISRLQKANSIITRF